jgi:hypothetical protein
MMSVRQLTAVPSDLRVERIELERFCPLPASGTCEGWRRQLWRFRALGGAEGALARRHVP